MNIVLTPELAAVLNELAGRRGVSPQELALEALRSQFLRDGATLTPVDDWERIVLGVATDCGVSLPHSALSSEGIYE